MYIYIYIIIRNTYNVLVKYISYILIIYILVFDNMNVYI